MKATLIDIQDSFHIGYESYKESREEARKLWGMYHNRQFTNAEKAILSERGQPKETFNIIKLYSRVLLGYYSNIKTSFKVLPNDINDITTANILQDICNQVVYENNFISEADFIKLDGFLSGLFCTYINVHQLEKKDKFGRPHHKIDIEYVPTEEIILDPKAKKSDYSDARYIHRYRWLSSEEVIKMFGKKAEKKLDAYFNHLNITEANFEYKYKLHHVGKHRRWEEYLIVHSIIEDDKGHTWSVWWHNETILTKKKVTYKDVKNPYRVVKLNDSNISEYYGIFREVYESQRAINQAIISIQMMVNTNKYLIQKGSVENIDEFTKNINRVNSVTEVLNLDGVRLEHLNGDIQQQYAIIANGMDRIQKLLGINDSFLGQAFASDSGRKVKLQQQQSAMQLRYIDTKLELLYKLIGTDIINLIKQYYTANQIVGIVDDDLSQRWVEINKPISLNGQFVYDEDLDPASGEPRKDEFGNIILVPLNDADTDLHFTNADIHIESTNYSQEDENNQLMIETMLSGNIGNALMTVNPSGFFKIASKTIKNTKTRDSQEMAKILDDTSNMLSPQPQQQEQLGMGGGSGGTPKSQSNKLPQNTNQGA